MSRPRSLSDSAPASATFRYANNWPRMRHGAGAGSQFDNTDDHPAEDNSPTAVPSSSQENAAIPSHNRGRARTLQLTPRKRRISTIQREATRMRNDSPERGISSNIANSSPSPSLPSEASSPLRLLANASSSHSSSLEANSTSQSHTDPPAYGENLSGGDVPEYPEWLRDLLQEGGERPAVALAYQLPSASAEVPHTIYTPLRGSYKITHWSASTSTHKNFGYLATKDGSSFTILEQPSRESKSNKESWFSKIRNQSAKIFYGRPWSTFSNRGAAADPVSVVSPETSKDVSRPALDANRIAVEIWENIMQHLHRDDWKNLRLVNKAVERNTSGTVFRTVVVPFTADIYGVLYDSMAANTEKSSNWAPKKGKLDIFGGFGQHIKNFGMRFEVDQVSLSNPPVKVLQQGHESYWGTYNWPFPQYTRFQDRADLEVTADETSAMKEAFSQLNNVLHMALSLDCGLGWLCGPDMSIRARVLSHPDTIFEHSLGAHGGLSAQQQLWTLLEKTFELSGVTNLMYEELVRHDVPNLAELRRMIEGKQNIRTNSRIALEANLIDELPKCKQPGGVARQSGPRLRAREDHGVEGPEWQALSSQLSHDNGPLDSPGSSSNATALMQFDAIDLLSASNGGTPSSTNKPVPEVGLLYTRPVSLDVLQLTRSRPFFAPDKLTKDQKEWLLESAWAQDAFLSSYILAITDNAGSFQNVRNLTITKLSSRHLPKLCRDDFWDSLPCLKCVDLRVIADHRDVQKNEAGLVDTMTICPSDAIVPFNQLLSGFISTQPSIVSLCIGWADGGEFAEGIFARNQQILPTPLTQKPLNTDEQSWRSHLLRLPHVKKLTLTNCWITPNALSAFLTPGIFAPVLEDLKFESVSLTEHPRFEYQAVNPQPNHNHIYNHNPNQNNNQNHNPNQPPNIHGVLNAVPGQQPWNPQAAHLQNPGQVNQAVAILQQHAHGNAVPPGNFIHTLHQALATVQQMHGFQVALAVAWGLPLPQQAGTANTLPIREGSWTNVLHGAAQSRELVKTRGELRFSFLSCGYARLRGTFFNQTGMDEAEAAFNLMYQVPTKQAAFFNNRRGALSNVMMTSHDTLQGHIVHGRTAFEIETLKAEFGLGQGWPNSDNMGEEAWAELDEGEWGKWGEKNKAAAEYDGAREGGTGRFSGVIVYHGHTDDEEQE